MAEAAEPGWPAGWGPDALAPREALDRFDGLADLAPEELLGSWRGRSLPTGHPLDGLLEALGWHGKAVESPESVHPLLFRLPSGRIIPLEPSLMPTGLALRWPGFFRSGPARRAFAAAAPLLRAREPGARLALRDLRGRTGTALIYRRQPILDHLRRIGPDHVMGLMERDGMDLPFFFLLART